MAFTTYITIGEKIENILNHLDNSRLSYQAETTDNYDPTLSEEEAQMFSERSYQEIREEYFTRGELS